MEKKLILQVFLFFILITNNIYTQCNDPAAFGTIDGNKVKANFQATGELFTDPQGGYGYVVPFTPGLPEVFAIQAGALWLGAYDAQGNLKVSAQNYAALNGKYDWQPGPLDNSSGTPVAGGCENFDRVWEVNRGDILELIQDFEDNGMINFPISPSLLTWPGKGNPHFETITGFPLPDQTLAPFFDRNNNGIYEPLNGEYPVVNTDAPAVIPDEMLWCVFNDLHLEHSGTGGSPLGVEVHLLVYAFNCADNELLNHSIFTRHTITNKSGFDLFNFRLGVWLDAGMGCPHGDYFGSDTLLNSIYFYEEPDPNSCNDLPTFGENPPSQFVTLLNHQMDHFIFYGTPGPIYIPPPQTTKPSEPIQFYHFLTGKWGDGTPLTYGGTGFNPSSIAYVSHVFFDNPNNPGWSMPGNSPYLRYSVIPSTGTPVFLKNEAFTLDAAYSFHRVPGADFLENVNAGLEDIPGIQAFYDDGFTTGSCTQIQTCSSDCVWPGDANSDGIGKEDDLLYLVAGIAEGNYGPVRIPPSHLWSPQPSEDWGISFFDGKDFKHADFNGDGHLDSLDGFVLDLNFYLEKPGFIGNQTESPEKDGELYVKIFKNAISTQENALKRHTVAAISLASENAPFQPLSGISCVIEFDTSIFIAPTTNLPMYDLLAQTLLGHEDEVFTLVKAFPEKGQIAVGMARKDGLAAGPTFGNLLNVAMEVRNDALMDSPDTARYVKLKVYDAYGTTSNGEIIPLGVEYDSVLITRPGSVSTTKSQLAGNLTLDIFPNPNNGSFMLSAAGGQSAKEIAIYNPYGKLIWQSMLPAGQPVQYLELENYLQRGFYVLSVSESNARFATQKLIIK